MLINLLVIIFIISALHSILFKKYGLNDIIIWVTYGMVIGYRTFEPIQGLKIHPIEVLVYAGIIRIVLTDIYPIFNLPKIIVFLSYIFLAFFILDLFTRYNPIVLLEFKNAFILVSIFFIIKYIPISDNTFTSFTIAYLKSVTLISFLGIIEYNYPEVISSIFGFENNYSLDTKNSILFNRLAFLFWGSHLAANLIPPIFPMLMYLKWKEHAFLKVTLF